MIRLKQFAEKHNINYKTAHKWFQWGMLEGAIQTASGTILVPEDAKIKQKEKTDQ